MPVAIISIFDNLYICFQSNLLFHWEHDGTEMRQLSVCG